MPRIAPKYTPTQRAAVVRASVDDLTPPAEIRRRAAAGELYGLEPFDIPASTIYSYRKRELRRRERAPRKRIESKDGATAARELRTRLLLLADGILQETESQLRACKLEPDRFDKTARTVLRIADELERKLDGKSNGDLHEPEQEPEPEPAGWLERIAAEASAGAVTTPPTDNRDPTSNSPLHEEPKGANPTETGALIRSDSRELER